MRTFIALKPDKKALQKILLLQKDLQKIAEGRWIPEDNLHLTLVFIGDMKEEKTGAIRNLLLDIPFYGTDIYCDHIGAFQSKKGEILWLGIKKNIEIMEVQKELIHLLGREGFALGDRTFLPHITLGRNVRMKKRGISVLRNVIHAETGPIRLYRSDEINGKRIYTEL